MADYDMNNREYNVSCCMAATSSIGVLVGEVERIAIFHLLPRFSNLRQHLRDKCLRLRLPSDIKRTALLTH
jgi:hypothetical protein